MGDSVRTDTEDWPKIVGELHGAGMMKKAIARKIGVAPSTLGNLTTGMTAEPPYSVGVKLKALHARIVLER